MTLCTISNRRGWAPVSLGLMAIAGVAFGQNETIHFENETEASGFVSLPNRGGHGIQVVDVDGDAATSSIQLSLVGPNGEAGALGARVRLYAAGHLGAPEFLRGFREVRGASGYCAQESPRVHFGVDASSSYDVEVRFPDGTTVSRTNLRAGIHSVDSRQPN